MRMTDDNSNYCKQQRVKASWIRLLSLLLLLLVPQICTGVTFKSYSWHSRPVNGVFYNVVSQHPEAGEGGSGGIEVDFGDVFEKLDEALALVARGGGKKRSYGWRFGCWWGGGAGGGGGGALRIVFRAKEEWGEVVKKWRNDLAEFLRVAEAGAKVEKVGGEGKYRRIYVMTVSYEDSWIHCEFVSVREWEDRVLNPHDWHKLPEDKNNHALIHLNPHDT